jgi:hypothetical protein
MLSEEGMWQELLHNKYLKNTTLAEVEAKPSDSPFWKGLMRAKDEFLVGAIFKWVMIRPYAFGRIFG